MHTFQFLNAFASVPSSPRPEGNLPRSRGELGMGGVKGGTVRTHASEQVNSLIATAARGSSWGLVAQAQHRIAPGRKMKLRLLALALGL